MSRRKTPIRVDLIEPEDPEWLWEDRIPRKMISIVAGKRDQGKGLFWAMLAAHISKSRFPGKNGRKRWGHVIVSAAEDSESLMTRPRLAAAGAVLANIECWNFRLPSGINALAVHMEAHQTDLIILDPFARHLDSGISRHNDSVEQVTEPLTDLIEQMGAAVLVVEHVVKGVTSNKDPIDAIGGGSSGIVAAARMGFIMGRDPEDGDRRILACVKHNICEERRAFAFNVDAEVIQGTVSEIPFLIPDEECDFEPIRLLTIKAGEGRQGRPPDKRAAAAEWLSTYLYNAGNPVPTATVMEDARQVGIASKTLRKAASMDVGVIKNPPGGGPKVTWELPPGLRAIMDNSQGGGDMEFTDKDADGLLGGEEDG